MNQLFDAAHDITLNLVSNLNNMDTDEKSN